MTAAPVYPIRRVSARWNKKLKRFLPCTDTDRRGTLVMDVDAAGRPVMAVSGAPFGAGQTLGWKLCFPTNMQDPGEFLAWIQANRLEMLK